MPPTNTRRFCAGRRATSAFISTSRPPAAVGSTWSKRFFRDLTENQLRRGVFTSVEALQKRILAYIQEHNRQPKPFIWTAKANDILEKVKRAKANLNNSLSV